MRQNQKISRTTITRLGTWVLAWVLSVTGPTSLAETLVVGNTGPMGFRVEGMALDPGAGTLYGTSIGEDAQLVRIESATGKAEAIGPLGFNSVRALAFDPDLGILYGSDTESRVLLRIDPVTGAGTAIGPLAAPPVVGLAFDEATRTLYGAAVQRLFGDEPRNSLLRIDPSTGESSRIDGPSICDGISNCASLAGLAFERESGLLHGAVEGGGVIRIDPADASYEWVSSRARGADLSALAPSVVAGTVHGLMLSTFATVDTETGSVELIPAPGADFGNIETALDLSSPGDVVLVMPGRYTSVRVDSGVQILGSRLGPVEVTDISVSAISAGIPIAVHRLEAGTLRVSQSDAVVLLSDLDVSSQLAPRWFPSPVDFHIAHSADVRAHRSVLRGSDGREPVGDGILCCNSGARGLALLGARIELVSSTVQSGSGTCDWDCCRRFPDGCTPPRTEGALAVESRVHAAMTSIGAGTGSGSTSALELRQECEGILAGRPESVIEGASVWAGASLRYSGVKIGWVGGQGDIVRPPLPDPTLELVTPYTDNAPVVVDVHAVPGATVKLLVGARPERVSTPGVLIDRLLDPLKEYDIGTVGSDEMLRAEFEVPEWWPGDAWVLAQAEVTYPGGEFHRTNSVMTPTAGTPRRFALERLRNTRDDVLSLPDHAVTTRGNRQALANFIAQAADHIERGEIDLALDRLEKALLRSDGCHRTGAPDGKTRGPGPDPDFITTCDEQDRVQTVLEAARGILVGSGT